MINLQTTLLVKLVVSADLDSALTLGSLDIWDSPSGPILWDIFPYVQLEDVDRIFGKTSSTTRMLNPCPPLLFKEAKLLAWLSPMMNSSEDWRDTEGPEGGGDTTPPEKSSLCSLSV